jgi:hypothetical protein
MDKPHGLTGKPSNNTGKLKSVKKTEVINIKLTVEKRQKWKDYAQSRGISLTKLIEQSVDSVVV